MPRSAYGTATAVTGSAVINNLAYYGIGAETCFSYELVADKTGDVGGLAGS